MNSDFIAQLLDRFRSGQVDRDDAVREISSFYFEDLGFARVDHHRAIRKGFPEVIFGQGKTPDEIAALFQKLAERSSCVLSTRTSPEAASLVHNLIPDAVYYDRSRCLVLDRRESPERIGNVVVVCAGTSDLPVAEEAAVTADLMGARVHRITDAGVAGIHRLLSEAEVLRQARVVVVVAGMEGALPSVVGGLVASPVLAVPTSVGYGASFHGLAALLAMLSSCASGVSVVNIDNGFGAGFQAALINRLPESCRED